MADNTPTTFTADGAQRIISAVRTVEGAPRTEFGPKMPYHFVSQDQSLEVAISHPAGFLAGAVGYVGLVSPGSTTPHFFPGYPWTMGLHGREDYYRSLPAAIVVTDIPAGASTGRVWTTGIHSMRVDPAIHNNNLLVGDILGRNGFNTFAGYSPYPDFVVVAKLDSPLVLASILQQPYPFRMAKAANPQVDIDEGQLCRIVGGADGFLLVDAWDAYTDDGPAVAVRWIGDTAGQPHSAPIIQSGRVIANLSIPSTGDYAPGRAIPDDLGRVIFERRIDATWAEIALLPEDRGGVLVEVPNHPELNGYYKTIEFDPAYWSISSGSTYGRWSVAPV